MRPMSGTTGHDVQQLLVQARQGDGESLGQLMELYRSIL